MKQNAIIESTDNPRWYFKPDNRLEPFPNMWRRKRCCSCKRLLNAGDLTLRFRRFRYPNSDIELKIFHQDERHEIVLAPWFMCRSCASAFHAIEDSLPWRQSVNIACSMEQARAEYQKRYGELKS